MGNSFGKHFVITVFGESHGRGIGVVIDGCPAGLPLALSDIQVEVDRRRPGSSAASTSRAEEDRLEILCGVKDGCSTGAPVAMFITNRDMDDSVYEQARYLLRPGHADYTAFVKYGGFNDWRGGGMFSGRITAGFVMAGAVARKLLSLLNVEILAHAVEIGGVRATALSFEEVRENVEKSPLRCADLVASSEMESLVKQVREAGDSIGGIIEGIARNVPAGLGEPVFDTLDGEMAKALLAIPAVKGVEFGAGFGAARLKGSLNNDAFALENGKIVTKTNHAGGVLGGLSSGMPLTLRVAVKLTPSIALEQQTVDIKNMKETSIKIRGRHDACIVPRAVLVVEAVMAFTLADFALRAGMIPGVIK